MSGAALLLRQALQDGFDLAARDFSGVDLDDAPGVVGECRDRQREDIDAKGLGRFDAILFAIPAAWLVYNWTGLLG